MSVFEQVFVGDEQNVAIDVVDADVADTDVIVALSSGKLPSPIGLVRLSGHRCFELISPLLGSAKVPTSPLVLTHGTVRYGVVWDQEAQSVLDDVMVACFRGPRSFTGEDTLEVSLHGGPYVVQRFLSLCFQKGARQASPGEFTRRAFLNGKLDLTSAEGIHELIMAQSVQQWRAGRQLTEGKLQQQILNIRDRLLKALTLLAARIDFPDEEETAQVVWEHLDQATDEIRSSLEALAASYQSGKIASQGLSVALMGHPNVGKSTLLNTLLGSDRAIVTDIPGTTRDFLEESCLIEGRLFRLIDTAGLRKSDDTVEKIGIQRSLDIAKQCDLILWLKGLPVDPGTDSSLHDSSLHDSSLHDSSLHDSSLTPPETTPVWEVWTKSDLLPPHMVFPSHAGDALTISCHRQMGIDELRRRLVRYTDQHISELDRESVFITHARHQHALKEAIQYMQNFNEQRQHHVYEEILADTLQRACGALEEMVGKIHTDDVLGNLFSTFCIGK